MVGFGPLGRFPLGENSRGTGITGSLAITLADVVLATTATIALKGALTDTLADATLAATGTVALTGAASIALDDTTLAATGAVALTGSLAKTLDDVTLSGTAGAAIVAALTVTLDDLTYVIHGGPELSITDLQVLQLPVDCILAGDQHYKQSGREYEIRPMNMTEKTWGKHSRVRALSGGRPSFTSTTGKRGYD